MAATCRSPTVAPSGGLAAALFGVRCGDRSDSDRGAVGSGDRADGGFHLDLDGLVGVPELYMRSASEKSYEDAKSLVGEVSKETALLLAGAELESTVLMDELAYDENVGEWAKAMRGWMQ
jgi:hypothetical protein